MTAMNPKVQLPNIIIACLLLAIASSCVNQDSRLSQIDTSHPSTTRQPDTLARNQAISGVITAIAAYPRIDDEFTGVGGIRSKQYQRLEWLSKYPSEKELLALVSHKNNNVKVYAFWALANRKSPAIKSILEEHLHDSSTISYMAGCIISDKRLNLFLLNKASPTLSNTEKEGYLKKMKAFYGKEQWEAIEKWEKFL